MNLFWTDVKNNKYLLGNLYKKDDYFYFDINETELKQAILHGCFGIGTINISRKTNKSKELFDFFKNRVPEKDNVNIDNFLKSINLETYDEYEILKKTKGRLLTDRYFLED